MKTTAIVATLVILAGGRVAQADPVLYSVTGRVMFMGSEQFEDLDGSFLLSDPRNQDGLTDYTYSLTNFVLGSSRVTLAGSGDLFLRSSYATDSFFNLRFDQPSSYVLGSRWNNVVFEGSEACRDAQCWGAQPEAMRFLFTDSPMVFSTSGGTSTPVMRFDGLSAQRIPEPASLSLVGLGGLAFGLVRRRAAKRRSPSAAVERRP
jgi:hypothetical protein